MTAEWYYLTDGEKRGPVTGARLTQLAQSGDLAPTDLVWRDGMQHWLPAGKLGLSRKEPVPPPPPAPVARTMSTERRERAPRLGSTSERNQRGKKGKRPTNRVLQVAGICAGGISILACGVWIGYSLQPNAVNRTLSGDGALANRVERRSANAAIPPRPMSAPPSRETSPSRSEAPGDVRAISETEPDVAPPNAMDSVLEGPDDHEVRPQELPPRQAVRPGGPSANTKPLPLPASQEPDARNQPDERGERPRNVAKSPLPKQPLFQEIDVQRRPTFVVRGVTVAQSIRYRILSRLDVERQTPEGTRQVVQAIVATRLEHADDLSRATFVASLEKMQGRRFTYTLSPHNEVIDFSGHKKDVRSASVETGPGKGFLLTSVIDKDGWKELAELTFFRPGNGESTGEKTRVRQMTHDWSPLGSWEGITTFVKRGQEDRRQRFDFSHKMTYMPPKNREGVLPFRITSAEFRPEQASGSLLFDSTLDRVTGAEETFRVKGVVGTELLGQSMVIQLEENQTMKITIVDQNPWGQTP